MGFFRAFLPTVLMFIIALAVIIGSLGVAYYSNHKASETLSYHLVSASLDRTRKVMDVLLLDNAWWDDAFVNLTLNYDPDWFFRNLALSDLLDNTIHGLAFIRNDGTIQNQFTRGGRQEYSMGRNNFGEEYGFILEQALQAGGENNGPFSFVGKISNIPTLFSICTVAAHRPEVAGDFPPEKSDFMIFWKILQKEDLRQIANDVGLPSLAFSKTIKEAKFTFRNTHEKAIAGLTWEGGAGNSNMLVYLLTISLVMFGLLVIGGRISYIRISQMIEEINAARLLAQANNRIKSEFLATMSHELRTPLNSIIGFSEVLKGGGCQSLDENQMEYVNYIHSSGCHLLTIINEVLDMSKIEAGKIVLYDGAFDIDQVIHDCLRLTQYAANEKHIRFVENLSDDIPDINGDFKLVKQILLNILSNAIKFTNAEGVITVSSWLASNRELHVCIEDNGIGIPSENIPLIMLPYVQNADHRTRSEQGTGLGLSIAKAYMELHDGRLEIDSELDKGTKVTLIFPAERVL